MYVCVVVTFTDDPRLQRGEIVMSTADYKAAVRWQTYKASRISTPQAALVLFAGETKPWDAKGRINENVERLSPEDFDQSGED